MNHSSIWRNVIPSPLLSKMMLRLHSPVYFSRIRELARLIVPHLSPDNRIVDVGCGAGVLGRAILDHPHCPPSVRVHGLETNKRDECMIEMVTYDGRNIPYTDNSHDVVILADVLHHSEDPDGLISECKRVAKKRLIIKDHQIQGPLAQARISLLDWAANVPNGVPCRYRYNTPAQWDELIRQHELTVRSRTTPTSLYPSGFNLLFGRGLHYFAVLDIPRT